MDQIISEGSSVFEELVLRPRTLDVDVALLRPVVLKHNGVYLDLYYQFDLDGLICIWHPLPIVDGERAPVHDSRKVGELKV